ncbi:hypothetical protein [Streptomyces lushanensis]|uniref:hypothetical protein n=1 Tax=Streptomyces lushanensis TaxID=1434255 RepID=UPI00114C99C7|nr:hypothetical protein [Streptomyces lushanensis]
MLVDSAAPAVLVAAAGTRTTARERARLARAVSVFDSAATRMLLISDGLTTPLLQAALGAPLEARVTRLSTVPSGSVSPMVSALLDGAPPDQFLVRRTTLALPDGEAVSENTTVLRLGVDRRIDTVAADRTRPIGFALAEAGLLPQRRILHVGTARWPLARDPLRCAAKTYLLDMAAGPVMCIEELFNPSLISALPAAGRAETPAVEFAELPLLAPEGIACSGKNS